MNKEIDNILKKNIKTFLAYEKNIQNMELRNAYNKLRIFMHGYVREANKICINKNYTIYDLAMFISLNLKKIEKYINMINFINIKNSLILYINEMTKNLMIMKKNLLKN